MRTSCPPPSWSSLAHALLRRLVDLALNRARHDAGALDASDDSSLNMARGRTSTSRRSGRGRLGLLGPHLAAGHRLALVGTSAGLSVVDVTNWGARVTAAIAGGSSAWREVGTYRQPPYVTTEAQTGSTSSTSATDRPTKLRTWSDTFASRTRCGSRGARARYAHGTQAACVL